jgi:hypothetical protein
MSGYDITLIEIARLKPTEMVDAAHVERLVRQIRSDGRLYQPVLVERGSLAILDGHHRWHAATRLGLARIPAILLAYGDPRLTLASWTSRVYCHDDVIRAAMTRQLMPPKSTRHLLDPPPPPMPVALESLGVATSSA